MMKNTFYFMLKVLFLCEYLDFYPDFLVIEKQLDKKTLIDFKFMTSQTGQ